MHLLCRFFLDHCGPTHESGEQPMLPFLISMHNLFELFIAEWLRAHLPDGYQLDAQHKVSVGEQSELSFDIDLVIIETATGKVHSVLDTKYKAPDFPSTSDISQVTTYAELKSCRQATLIYPTPIAKPLDVEIGQIRVHSEVFRLDGDLETEGRRFLERILPTRGEFRS